MILKKITQLESIIILNRLIIGSTTIFQRFFIYLKTYCIKRIIRKKNNILGSLIVSSCLNLISGASIAEVVDISFDPEKSSINTTVLIDSSTHEDIWNSALAIMDSSNNFALQSSELTSLTLLLDEVSLEKIDIINDNFLISNFIFDYQPVERESLFTTLAFETDDISKTSGAVNTISSRLQHQQRLLHLQHMRQQHLQYIRHLKR
jgi:sporulation protein YlmC with PRC-barrel domain